MRGLVRASLVDQEGPTLARALPSMVVLPVVLGVLVAGAALDLWSAWYVLLSLAAPLIAGFVPTVQREAREVELELGPGYVEVHGAGLRNRRIRAKQIVGASTAWTSRGVLLSLSLAGGASPLLLELEDEAQVDRVRTTLGIGHEGFGTISWQPTWSNATKASLAGRIILALLAAFYAVLIQTKLDMTFELVAQTLQPLVVGAALTLLGAFPSALASSLKTLSMGADGVRVWTQLGWTVLPYAAIHDVRIEPDRIVFVGPPFEPEVPVSRSRLPWGRDGLTDVAASALRAQILSAARRARGEAKPKEELAGRLELLRRGHHEHPRDWLVRLDAAATMLGAGTGYRGQTLDVNELWAVLEDPDADGELRTAAARVLRSSGQPDVRVRIDAAVEATRDEVTNAKMRVAVERDVDEVDQAGQELVMIDTHGPGARANRWR